MAEEKIVKKTDEKPAKKAKKKGKLIPFLRSCKAELKKIVWTSPKAVRMNSIMVIIAMVVLAAITGAVDLVFNKFFYILAVLI